MLTLNELILKALIYSSPASLFLSWFWIIVVIFVIGSVYFGDGPKTTEQYLTPTVFLSKLLPNFWYSFLIAIDILQGISPDFEISVILFANLDWIVALIIYLVADLEDSEWGSGNDYALKFMIASLGI